MPDHSTIILSTGKIKGEVLGVVSFVKDLFPEVFLLLVTLVDYLVHVL